MLNSAEHEILTMLNSAEHEILKVHNYDNIYKFSILYSQKKSRMLSFLLIMLKCQQLLAF